MRKIVIASDSFKGSLTSSQVAEAVEEGILSVFPNCRTLKIPVADGGEGTCEVLINASDGKEITVRVNNPLMRMVVATYGIINDGNTAVIEMAAASGLTLLSPEEYNPWITSTYGTGELIKDALERGCRDFIIGVGGSATNDAGTGLLRALGYRFLDSSGEEVPDGGQSLVQIVAVDESGVIPAVKEARFTVACDVINTFSGTEGAANVYAPQKGADTVMARKLDEGLESFRQLVIKQKQIDLNMIPGSGAAGGLGGGLLAFMDAELKPGIEIVLEAVEFEKQLVGAQLVFTCEGKLDVQTSQGKTPAGVLTIARRHDIPVIAIGGSVEDIGSLNEHGFLSVYSISQASCSLQEAMKSETAKKNIRQAVEQIMRTIQYFDIIP